MSQNQSFIEGIEYTEIPVNDLDVAIDWYCNKLGAKLGMQNSERAFVDFSTGPSLFLVKTIDQTTSTFLVNGEDHYTIGFRVSKLEEFHQYLSAQGAVDLKLSRTVYKKDVPFKIKLYRL